MVSDRQVRVLRKKRMENKTLEAAATALRAVIAEARPQGTQAVLAAYHDALQGPLDALRASREEFFARILAEAQKAASAAAFDPHKLPGGSPFVLFDAHTREGDRKLIDDALRSGQVRIPADLATRSGSTWAPGPAAPLRDRSAATAPCIGIGAQRRAPGSLGSHLSGGDAWMISPSLPCSSLRALSIS